MTRQTVIKTKLKKYFCGDIIGLILPLTITDKQQKIIDDRRTLQRIKLGCIQQLLHDRWMYNNNLNGSLYYPFEYLLYTEHQTYEQVKTICMVIINMIDDATTKKSIKKIMKDFYSLSRYDPFVSCRFMIYKSMMGDAEEIYMKRWVIRFD